MAFRCRNCGGSVLFDIASQKLKCQHCSSTFSPGDYQMRDQSGQTDIPEAELSLFLCNNCGAALESTEDSHVGFCPYCGGQSMIRKKSDSGIGIEHIIPFQVTREQCTEGYQSFTKKILYLPRELKNTEFLNHFTGIYMPYFEYDVELGASTIKGTTKESHSNYDLVHTYQIDMDVTGNTCDVFYDASRYLDDEIAARALPFDTGKEKPFSPAYLSGFYADASTVSEKLYYKDAQKQASEDVVDVIAGMMKEQMITVDKETSSVHTKTKAHHAALFPMWFLTWRKESRVAYAVVNGQSGKVVSDLPVDRRAFSLGSAGIALVLFLLLELLFQPTPLVTSVLSMIAAAVMAFSILSSTKQLQEKQTHEKDKGWTDGKTEESARPATGLNGWIQKLAGKWYHQDKNAQGGILSILIILVPIAAVVLFVLLPTFVVRTLIYAAIPLVLTLYAAWKVSTLQQDIPEKYPIISILAVLVSVIINAAVILIAPVKDVWYYLGDAVCIIGLIFAAIGMLQIYNIGTTRPLPTLFDRKEVDLQ